MSDSKSIAVIGCGGHASVVVDSLLDSDKRIEYYSDIKESILNPFKLKYLGNESNVFFKGWDMNLTFALGIGNNIARERAALLILSKSKSLELVLHSKSCISKFAKIGKGIFASSGVVVNAFSEIGDFAILNTGCIIEHNCIIGTAAHIAPGTVLAGNVMVGKRSFIGANSVIKQGVKIGDDVIVGAGSVIIKDVPSNSKIFGNPGRIIE